MFGMIDDNSTQQMDSKSRQAIRSPQHAPRWQTQLISDVLKIWCPFSLDTLTQESKGATFLSKRR